MGVYRFSGSRGRSLDGSSCQFPPWVIHVKERMVELLWDLSFSELFSPTRDTSVTKAPYSARELCLLSLPPDLSSIAESEKAA